MIFALYNDFLDNISIIMALFEKIFN